MTPERWHDVEELFHAARDLAGSDRANYLDRACGEDAELRREVEALLAEDQAATLDVGRAIEHQA